MNKPTKPTKKETTKSKEATKNCTPHCRTHHHGSAGAIYGFGFIGAAAYYITTSTGFWMGVWGVIKAIVWPVFLVYEAFKYLGLH